MDFPKFYFSVGFFLLGIFSKFGCSQEQVGQSEDNNFRTGRRIDPQTVSVQEVLRNFRNSLRTRGKAPPLPNYGHTQPSNFSCTQGLGPGYYSDPAFGCQQYYRCDDKLRRSVFICPPGTLFNQLTLVCDFPYNVDCSQVANYYEYSNSRLYQNNIPLLETISAEDASNNYKSFYNQNTGQSQSSTTNAGQSSLDADTTGANQEGDGTAERDGRFGMVFFRPNTNSQSQTTNVVNPKKNRIVAASAVATQTTPPVILGKQRPATSTGQLLGPRNVPLQAPGHAATGSSQASSSNINQYIVNPYPTITTYSIDQTHQSPSLGAASANGLTNASSNSGGQSSSSGSSVSNSGTVVDGPTQPSTEDSFDGLMDLSSNAGQSGTTNAQQGFGVAVAGQAQTGGRIVGTNQVSSQAASSGSGTRTQSGMTASGSGQPSGQSSSGSAVSAGSAGQAQGTRQASSGSSQISNGSSTGQTAQQGSGIASAGQAQTGERTPTNSQRVNQAATSSTQNRPPSSGSALSQPSGQVSSGSATGATVSAGQSQGQGSTQASHGSSSATGSSSSGQISGQAQSGGRTVNNGQGMTLAASAAAQGRPAVSLSGSIQSTGQSSSGSASVAGSASSGQGSQQASSGSLQTSNTSAAGRNIQQGTNMQSVNIARGTASVATSTQPSNSPSRVGSSVTPLDIDLDEDNRFTSVWGPPNTGATVSQANAGTAQILAGPGSANQQTRVTGSNGQVLGLSQTGGGSSSQPGAARPNSVQSQGSATTGSTASSMSATAAQGSASRGSTQGSANVGLSSSASSSGQGSGARGTSAGQPSVSTGSNGVPANTGQGNGASGVSVLQGNNTYDLQFQNIWMPVPPGTDSMYFSATPNFSRNNEIPGARVQGPSQTSNTQTSATGVSSTQQVNAQQGSSNVPARTNGVTFNKMQTITSNPLLVQLSSSPAASRNQIQARTDSPQTNTGNANQNTGSSPVLPNQVSASGSNRISTGNSGSSSSVNMAASNTAHPITVKVFTACDKQATSNLAGTDVGSAMLKSLQSSSASRQSSSSDHATVIVNGYASYNSDVTSGSSSNGGSSGVSSGATGSGSAAYSMPSNPMISDDAYFIHEGADKPVFVRFAKYNIIVEIRPDTSSSGGL